MKAVINTFVRPTNFDFVVGSSMNHKDLAKAKKMARKRDRAMLKAFFQKEAVNELHADIAEAIEAARHARENAYREFIQRMMTQRRNKKLEKQAQRESAYQAEINARYGWKAISETEDYAPRKDAHLMVGKELRLVASCG